VVATRARWRVDFKSSGKTFELDEVLVGVGWEKAVGGGTRTGNADGDGCDCEGDAGVSSGTECSGELELGTGRPVGRP
jgi:hypothetical protein